MYPFVIVWKSKNLIENDYENYYGFADELNDIVNQLNDLTIDIIKSNEEKIKNLIYDDNLNWNKFCEIINNEPYNDSVFFDIKYFDIGVNKWYNLDIDDIDLEKNFIKSIDKIFNQKISLSIDITNKIDKVNNHKNKNILNQKNIKQILTLDL